jgi:hypothetical protein
MVLLPQHAPYTDPLGVLICGGSTVGAGYALDTCISMQPDVPNANWTIERMPSFRVMPCMAPLPDGTCKQPFPSLHRVIFGHPTDSVLEQTSS